MENLIYGDVLSVEPTEKEQPQEQLEKPTEPKVEEESEQELEKAPEEEVELDFTEEDFEEKEEIDEEIDLENQAEPPKKPQPAKVDAETQKTIDDAVSKRLSEISKQKNKATEDLDTFKMSVEESLKGFLEEGETVEDALMRLGAENEGISVDAFKTKIKAIQEEKSAQKQKIETQIRAQRDKDLNTIKQIYPNVTAQKIEDIDEFPAFAKLMQTGLYAATEAYELVNAKRIAADTKAYQKQKALNDSRAHLRATNTQSIAPSVAPVSKFEYENWKACYPKLSEKELIAKIRNSKN